MYNFVDVVNVNFATGRPRPITISILWTKWLTYCCGRGCGPNVGLNTVPFPSRLISIKYPYEPVYYFHFWIPLICYNLPFLPLNCIFSRAAPILPVKFLENKGLKKNKILENWWNFGKMAVENRNLANFAFWRWRYFNRAGLNKWAYAHKKTAKDQYTLIEQSCTMLWITLIQQSYMLKSWRFIRKYFSWMEI